MSKKKHRRKFIRKKVFIPPDEISSSEFTHPNATLIPEALLEDSSSGYSISADSTNAPRLGEETGEEAPYAQSPAELADKYLLSRRSIYLVAALAIIGFFFIQDNGAGRLVDGDALLWTIKKSMVAVGVVGTIAVIDGLVRNLWK